MLFPALYGVYLAAKAIEKYMKRQLPNNSTIDKAWRRFRRNKAAIVGLSIIFFTVFVAIFAPFIAPDPTPNANFQILEIKQQPMGFKTTLIYQDLPDSLTSPPISLWKKWLYGIPDNRKAFAVSSYTIQGDKVLYRRVGSPPEAPPDTLALASTLPPEHRHLTLAEQQQQFTQAGISHKTYYLGTDDKGRDILSRLILGTRVSLAVGLLAVGVSLLLGVTMGAWAGYYGGIADAVVMWLANVFWSIPMMLLVFALVLALGKGFWQVFLAVGLTQWVQLARLVRGQFISLREKEYVEAAHSLGLPDNRIIFKHLLPNAAPAIIVMTAANFASAILIEAGLSYLGIGVQEPQPSWGSMLRDYYRFIGTPLSYMPFVPGLAISALVLAFNLVGNGLRDALDVR